MAANFFDHREISSLVAAQMTANNSAVPKSSGSATSTIRKNAKRPDTSPEEVFQKMQCLLEDNIRLKMIIADLIASLGLQEELDTQSQSADSKGLAGGAEQAPRLY
jgi:hypothetical protein